MSNKEEAAALLRENSRLAQQVHRLQSIVSTLRDEVSDANAEIGALRRLFDEQKQILLQEIERERSWREALAKQAGAAKSVVKISVGTNTTNDSHTSTVADAATNTPGNSSSRGGNGNSVSAMVVGITDPREFQQQQQQQQLMSHNGSASFGSPPQKRMTMLVGSPVQSSALFQQNQQQQQQLQRVGSPSTTTPAMYQLMQQQQQQNRRRVTTNGIYNNTSNGGGAVVGYPLQEFSDWLCRSSNYHARDLCAMFEAMGAASVDEVCANVTEDDLTKFGIPLLKARSIMHLIMEQTAILLSTRRR